MAVVILPGAGGRWNGGGGDGEAARPVQLATGSGVGGRAAGVGEIGVGAVGSRIDHGYPNPVEIEGGSQITAGEPLPGLLSAGRSEVPLFGEARIIGSGDGDVPNPVRLDECNGGVGSQSGAGGEMVGWIHLHPVSIGEAQGAPTGVSQEAGRHFGAGKSSAFAQVHDQAAGDFFSWLGCHVPPRQRGIGRAAAQQ